MLTRKLRGWQRRSWLDRALLVEAALWLALARLIVVLVPFRHIAPWLRRHPDAAPAHPALPLQVGRAVATAARHVPWRAVCLPQAIAAKAMLACRGQGAALHLGARIDDRGDIRAHAWLSCQGQIVVGRAGLAGMTALTQFG